MKTWCLTGSRRRSISLPRHPSRQNLPSCLPHPEDRDPAHWDLWRKKKSQYSLTFHAFIDLITVDFLENVLYWKVMWGVFRFFSQQIILTDGISVLQHFKVPHLLIIIKLFQAVF